MKKLKLSFALLSALLTSVSQAGDERSCEPICARLESIQSISVEYTLTYNLLKAQPTTAPTAKGNSLPYRDGRTTHETFRFNHGASEWVIELSQEDVDYFVRNGVRPVAKRVLSFQDGLGETLQSTPGRGSTGSIQSQNYKPAGGPVDVGLGLRSGEKATDGWFSPESLRSLEISTNASGQVILARRNQLGHLLEWTYEPKLGYALVGYRRVGGPKNVVVHEVSARDFRIVDGVPLPFEIIQIGRSLSGADVLKYTAVVSAYSFAPSDNTHIAYPKGTKVVDARTGNVYRVQQEAQHVTDEILAGASTNGGGPVKLLRPYAVPAVAPSRHYGWGTFAAAGLVVTVFVALVLRRQHAGRKRQHDLH